MRDGLIDMKIRTETEAIRRFHKKHPQFKGVAIYGEEHLDDDQAKYWNIFKEEDKGLIGIVYEDGTYVKF